jgi:hypothetical protein
MADLRMTVSVDARGLQAVVLDEIARVLSQAFRAAARGIGGRVGAIATEAVRNSPEYASLLDGKLRHELGVVDAAPILKAVTDGIADGVSVTSLGCRRAGEGIEGGMRVEILKGDYSEVLSVPGARFVSEQGYDVEWLRWLTLEGDRLLVAEHHFVKGFTEFSRTGNGIMIRGGSWRVPPEFSGTREDNWLLRALVGSLPEMGEAIVDEIRRAA